MCEPATKTPKTMTRIGTHSGNFHVDEALACYLLKTLPEYADAEIVRTRDPAVIDSCDIVVSAVGREGSEGGEREREGERESVCVRERERERERTSGKLKTFAQQSTFLFLLLLQVDVGGKYDPATHRYDHHQREFTGTMRTLAGLNFDTKLSSAGLVYLHFGKRVCCLGYGRLF